MHHATIVLYKDRGNMMKRLTISVWVDQSDHEKLIKDFFTFLSSTNRVQKLEIREKAEAQPQAAKSSPAADNRPPIFDLLEQWKKSNTLVRMKAVKSRGVMVNLACHIVDFDVAANKITVYDVDAKNVQTISINELEDIGPAL